MIDKLDRLLNDESGITALEAAIILIAFVVVAAVFAFTILQANTFSAEWGREPTSYISNARTSNLVDIVGAIKAQKDTADTGVITLTFELQAVAGKDGINVADTQSGANTLVISYGDDDEYVDKLNWSVEWIVPGDMDNLLETNEIVKITIPLTKTANNNGIDLGTSTEFILEIKPPQGSAISILRTMPASLDNVMFLSR